MDMHDPERNPETGGPLDYISGEGEPLAETMTHLHALMFVYYQLTQWAVLRGRTDVLTLVDNFWEYAPGDPRRRVAPDLFTMFGVGDPTAERTLWRESAEGGVRPVVVFEMASASTWRDNVGPKKDLYERLEVGEYFLYDPKGEFLDEHVLGWRLEEGEYVEIEPDAAGRLYSAALDVWLENADQFLRMTDARTGERILIPVERAAQERDRATLRAMREREQKELHLEERDEARELAEVRTDERDEARELAEVRTDERDEAREAARIAEAKASEAESKAAKALAEVERQRLAREATRERLRQLGIDPDTVM